MSFSAVSTRPRSPAVISGDHTPLSAPARTSILPSGSSSLNISLNARINRGSSQPNTPTSTTRPLPNLAGSSSSDVGASGHGDGNGSASAAAKKEKKKKKGWKGYAMQYLDDDGNVIEERPRDETPPEERSEREAKKRKAGEEVKHEMSEKSVIEMINEVASPAATVYSDPVIGTKRLNGSASPPLTVMAKPTVPEYVTTAAGPVALNANNNADRPSTSSSTSQQPNKPDTSRLTVDRHTGPPNKKRRKNSLSTTPQPPTDTRTSRANSSTPATRPAATSVPRELLNKGKGRSSLPNPPMTARQIGIAANNAAAKEAKEARDALSARASPYVVDDDVPLPKVPRIGMGEQFAAPPESNIRDEARFIIEQAESHRKSMRDSQDGIDGGMVTPPPTGHNDMSNTSQAFPIPLMNGDHPISRTPRSASKRQKPNPSSLPKTPPSQPDIFHRNSLTRAESASKKILSADDAFEIEFERMKEYYQEPVSHIMPIFPDEPRPPKFHDGQKPTVILAPTNGKNLRIRDKHERAHLEGYDGLPEQFENEIMGFVANVRANMRTVVQYYFDHPTLRRDAFIEKLGREVTRLGRELTDDGEAAISLTNNGMGHRGSYSRHEQSPERKPFQ